MSARLERFDLVLALAAAQQRIAELEAKLGPKPWCPDCGHPILAFHSIIGCQHLIPVYTETRLSHHDKCHCKTAPPVKP
jgi:hypothetical protein